MLWSKNLLPFDFTGHDERATAVEYGLMIAVVVVGAVAVFGTNLIALFSFPAGVFDGP